MKIKLYILSLVCITLLQTACSGDDKYIDSGSIEVENQNINLVIDESGTSTFSFNTSAPWTISITDTAQVAWLSVSQTSGPSGTNKISITPTPNTTEWDRKGYLTIKSGNSEVSIGVIQGFWNGIEDIPIADKNFKAYCLENFDTNKDGKLSFVEAKAVETIDLEGNNIESIAGIEYFVNAWRLSMKSINIKEVDLTKNPKLLHLICTSLPLETIDLSQNTSLIYISMNNTDIKILDLTHNADLKLLLCGFSSIEEIKMGGNPKISNIQCQGNQLKSLDVSNCVSLEYLTCWDNNLEQLKLTNTPQLKTLDCSNNKLTEVDFSESPKLESLMIYSNNLTFLDLTNNQVLKNMNCESNPRLREIWIPDSNKEIITMNYDSRVEVIRK